MNHPTDKIELIIMGGTFLDYPVGYQERFVKDWIYLMPSRIVKYLDEMDVLRGKVEVDIDELMAKINIRPMIKNPGKSADMFKQIIFNYMFRITHYTS